MKKIFSKSLLSLFLSFSSLIIFLTLSILFTSDAHAGPKGWGWAGYNGTGNTQTCVLAGPNTSRIIGRLYTENNQPISGGNISINGVNSSNGSDFGCMQTDGNFFVTASHPNFHTLDTAFTFISSVVDSSRNRQIEIAIWMVALNGNRTIEINSPTGGQFDSSPTFNLFVRRHPSFSSGSTEIFALVDNQYVLARSGAPFGNNISVGPLRQPNGQPLTNGLHTVQFLSRENGSPLPVSDHTDEVSFRIGPLPAPTGLSIQNDCIQTEAYGNLPKVRFSWNGSGWNTLTLQVDTNNNYADGHYRRDVTGLNEAVWTFTQPLTIAAGFFLDGPVLPQSQTSYQWRLVHDGDPTNGGSFTTANCPNPSPSPSPTPPPIPSTCQTQPGDPPNSCPCQNPKNTDYLTDNYIADDNGDPLDSDEFKFTLTTTGANGQTRTLTKDLTFSFDLAELQSLFADQNADYLEGKFQDGGHRTTNLLQLESSDFNKFHGPAQKVAPKAMVDALKAKYVKYVWDNPSLEEASFKYNDTAAQGGNKSVHDLVTAYGMPSPPEADESRTAWNNSWGKYWEKVPTSYNEFFKGYLVFKYAHSQKLIDAAKGKGDFEYCPRPLDRQITLVFPDFFRTAATAGQLNQVVVPKAAQTTEANNLLLATAENTKNILASVVQKCAQAIAGNPISKKIRKAVKVSLDNLAPLKTAYAQEPSPDPCVKVRRPSIGGISNYCALPAGQLQTGESCTNAFDTNQLDPDNLNVTCTVNVHWQHTFTIGTVTNIDVNNPENTTFGFDTCEGDPIVLCEVTVTVWPVFRIPFLREIWNNTTFSDEKELDEVGPVLGATLGEQNLSTITGRPGLHTLFKPEGATRDKDIEKKIAEQEQVQEQIIDEFIACGSGPNASEAACFPILFKFPLGANLKLAGSTNRSAGDIKERLIGATDCSKEFVRDVALKPKALQQHLGVVPLCNMVNQILAQASPPPGGGPPPPISCNNTQISFNGAQHDIQNYVACYAAGKTEPISGESLVTVMLAVLAGESGGGDTCSVGLDDEIGVFQYIAPTWQGNSAAQAVSAGGYSGPEGPVPRDSGSSISVPHSGGHEHLAGVCWKKPGYDDPSYAALFGLNIDDGAWDPYLQARMTHDIMLSTSGNGACNWTTFAAWMLANTGNDPCGIF